MNYSLSRISISLVIITLISGLPTEDFSVALEIHEKGANQLPTLPSHGIYRAYPGHAIQLPIDASDPEGGDLRYASDNLPLGAQLDELTGVLTWTPGIEQLGPFYIDFRVTDDGDPPMAVDGILIFQVIPLSDCTDPDCDPATGCDFIPIPISTPCCAGEPAERIAEPEAGCPEGLVLHVGRNTRSFGRLQNCDLFEVTAFPQGGANLTLHVEARCVNAQLPATIRIRLEVESGLILDAEQTADLLLRSDGYAQALGLIFAIPRNINVLDLENQEVLLTASLTDGDGLMVREKLRLTLRRDELEELPNPDLIVSPAGETGCIGCHRPLNPISGMRAGIEDPHPWLALDCIDCHGGNNDSNTYEEAHVFPTSGPGFIKNLALDKLDQVDADYVRFVNPGDLRVAAQSCGADSPADTGGGCHQQIVDSVPSSVMSTYAGHYTLPRYLAGSQDRESIYAAVDRTNPHFDPQTAPEGTVAGFEALRGPDLGERDNIQAVLDIYLPKACPTCHLSDFGPNDNPGKYRSSGCSACHMLYDDDGLSRSADPAIPAYFPPHPIKHELTTAIPVEQCAHCHFQGGRIGLAYRGIREGGFPHDKTPENAVPLGRSIYGHDDKFYFTDEDNTNFIDETPPDLHFEAGMVCADCHVGGDVHGDGNFYSSERYQVGIRCEDCHGTVRAAIEEDPADGFFKNSKGWPHKRIRRAEDDRILLKLATQDREVEIPQIHAILESGSNPRMRRAMGVRGNGFSHTDKLECYTCHTSWRQTCFGCHIQVNDRSVQLNLTTGEVTQGGILAQRDDYSTEFFALGLNARGKITPLCSSMSIFMRYTDEVGRPQFWDKVRTSGDGKVGFGWNPFFHHTVSKVPQNCDACHPVGSVEEPENAARLRETYGYGTGEFLATDDQAVTYDLSAFLNEDGELTSDFPHPNTGPVPPELRDRAASILVVPQSREDQNSIKSPHWLSFGFIR